MELEGLDAALALLHRARDEAVAMDDRLLLTLSRVQESNVRGRAADWRGSLRVLRTIGADEHLLNPSQRVAMYNNLGLTNSSLGRTSEAAEALTTALGLAVEHGLVDQEFKARHNLACVAFVDGDLPRALVLMREADATEADVTRDRARLDLAEVLLAAGLVTEARSALEDALVTAQGQGHRLEVGEISLRLARCDVLGDDLASARGHLRAAIAAYRTRQAPELVADAEIVRATVDIAAGHDVPGVVVALARRNTRTDGVDGPPTALDREARRLEAEARLLLGDVSGASARLATLGPAQHETLGGRLHELLVRARLDHATGRVAESAGWVDEGNRLLAAHQFQSSSLDVRASLALHGRRLAGFDVERSLATGDLDDTLTTVERWRAVSHRIDPVAPSPDPGLVDATRELRLLRRRIVDDGPATPEQLSAVAVLERRISEREWALAVTGAQGAVSLAADAQECRAGVEARQATAALLVESGGDLHVLTVDAASTTLRRVGPVGEVMALVTRCRRDLRARATLGAGSPMVAALARATASSVAALDHLLAEAWPGVGRVVVVPSGSLTAVPWNLLPSLRGRPVTVAPSLTRWLRGPAGGARRPVEPVRALHGPGLAWAAGEVLAVRDVWSPGSAGSDVGSGGGRGTEPDPGTSADVLDALAVARVVHLAAHGTHEPQSPLFSSVRMADGPVFAHEFPRPVAAEHVALSACDVGQFSTRPGEEPLGLAAALLSVGAGSVLAAAAPVADDLSAAAMVEHHRLLAAGTDAAEAWARVVEQRPEAGVFALYGSDWSARGGTIALG